MIFIVFLSFSDLRDNISIMGNDNLSIVSFNPTRKGLYSLSESSRLPYLQRLFEMMHPDICLLPGDDKSAKLNVIRGFGQYMTPNNDDTILLYDVNKVSMTTANVNLQSFGNLPGIDFDKIVCPKVEVSSLLPMKSVVKEFSIVTWHHTLFPNIVSLDNNILMESVLVFAQRLAMVTRLPIIIAGEINMEYRLLVNIVEKLGKENSDVYLQNIQPIMAENGYIPSITAAASRNERHKFMMKVYKCQKAYNSNSGNNIREFVPDCFIASKCLELKEPSILDLESVTAKHIMIEAVKSHCPTQTSMTIPVRPPRHQGG